MTKALVLYHSQQHGNTGKMAEEIAAGPPQCQSREISNKRVFHIRLCSLWHTRLLQLPCGNLKNLHGRLVHTQK